MKPFVYVVLMLALSAGTVAQATERRVVSVKVEPAYAQARAHFMPTPWNVEVRLYRYDTRTKKYLLPTRRVAKQQAGITSGEAQFTVDVLAQEAGIDSFYRVVCLGGSHYYDGISDEIPVTERFTENVTVYMKKRGSGAPPRDEYKRDPQVSRRETTTSRKPSGKSQRRVYVLDSRAPDIGDDEALRVFAGTWQDKKGNTFTLHRNWTVSGVLGEGNWTTKSPRQMKEIFRSFHNFRNLVIYEPGTLEVRRKYSIAYGPLTANEPTTYHGIDLSAGQNVMGISPNPVTGRSASEMFKRISK